MPEIPGQDGAPEADTVVVDPATAGASRGLLEGKGLTQTLDTLQRPGVVDMSEVVLSDEQIEGALEEIRGTQGEAVTVALDDLDL